MKRHYCYTWLILHFLSFFLWFSLDPSLFPFVVSWFLSLYPSVFHLFQWSEGVMPSYCHRARPAQFPQRWRAAGTQQGRLWLAAVCSGGQPGPRSHHIRHTDWGQSGALKLIGSERDGSEMRLGTKRRVTAFLNIKAAAQVMSLDGFILCLHVYVNTNTPVHT